MSPPAASSADPVRTGAAGEGALRVLVLTSSYPRETGDLAGVFVAEQAAALAARGHAVTVLAPGGVGLPRDRREGGVRVLRPRLAPLGLADGLFYGAGIADNLAARPARALALPPALASFAGKALRLARDADVLLSHWLVPSGLVAAAVAAAAGRGHVAVAHSGGVHLVAGLPRPAGRLLVRALLARTDHLFCAGPHLVDRLRAVAGAALDDERVSVLPVGLHTARYARRTPYAPPRPCDPLEILCVARLVPVKGVDTLLRAVAGRTHLRVTLVGDGPERARLEALARSGRSLARFVGAAPTDRIAAFLHEHHVLAVPSRVLSSGRTEGTPRAVLEALAAGVPVVASAVGGIPAVLAGGAGVLVPPDDPAALGAALDFLSTAGPRLAALSEAAARVAAAFDWDRALPSVVAALRSAAAAPRSRP